MLNNMSNNKIELNNPTAPELAIAWIDLTLYGRTLLCKRPKVILKEINGSIDFGTLNALMGPSGAGKSTLLKCINGRNLSEVDNNTQIHLSNGRQIRSTFIVQDVSEHLLMGLTAMQSLVYASKLKNSEEYESIDHKSNARKLLAQLMISDIETTTVGNCSGGEQKRLAIALELTAIKKPNLLCIDEPTSGLDSNAAEIVVQCLKELTRNHNIAIVTSIHQPNNDVLMLFDRLYVLGKGGVCVFEGPPQELNSHLTATGFALREHQVPIELLLKIASKYGDNLQRLAYQAINDKQYLKQRCKLEGFLAPEGIVQKSHGFSIKQMWYLFQRSASYSFRSQWKAMAIQFIFIVGLGLVTTKLYNKHCGEIDGCFSLGNNSNHSCVKTYEALREESLLSQNLRLHFFAGILIQFLLLVATTLIFATEVKIFFNEHRNGWYSTGAYYWSKTIVELPLCLLITICFSLIIYKNNNQIDDNQRLLAYISVLIAGVLCAQGIGFTIGIIANSSDKLSSVLSIGIYLALVMLCGFFAPLEELPEELRWISHLSFVKQVFECQLQIIYGFDRCPRATISTILYQNNLLDEHKFWINSAILGFHVINFRIIALVLLVFKSNRLRFGKSAVPNSDAIIEPIEQISHM